MKKSNLDAKMLERAADTLRTIAHPVRLEILGELEDRSRSVGELGRALGLPQAVISKHLGLLKNAGLLASETDGNFRHYSLVNTQVLKILNCIKKTCSKED